ncbi:MAG TPA: ATP-binding cassette domain-containing protein, partial [Ilumatobacteraceae bacterium]|nr:ATP-binding cassette domain-containing protein [Ilumatobacteraceae bacterium]
RFGKLSGGEAQRLMLAMAVAAQPRLLLIDEPTAQLDRATALDVTSVIAKLSEFGTTVIVATHDDAVRAVCNAVVSLG